MEKTPGGCGSSASTRGGRAPEDADDVAQTDVAALPLPVVAQRIDAQQQGWVQDENNEAEAFLVRQPRAKFHYSEMQQQMLENQFQQTQYVIGAERLHLAELTGLTEERVKIWFQNRRMKEKRQKRKADVLQGESALRRLVCPDAAPFAPSPGPQLYGCPPVDVSNMDLYIRNVQAKRNREDAQQQISITEPIKIIPPTTACTPPVVTCTFSTALSSLSLGSNHQGGLLMIKPPHTNVAWQTLTQTSGIHQQPNKREFGQGATDKGQNARTAFASATSRPVTSTATKPQGQTEQTWSEQFESDQHVPPKKRRRRDEEGVDAAEDQMDTAGSSPAQFVRIPSPQRSVSTAAHALQATVETDRCEWTNTLASLHQPQQQRLLQLPSTPPTTPPPMSHSYTPNIYTGQGLSSFQVPQNPLQQQAAGFVNQTAQVNCGLQMHGSWLQPPPAANQFNRGLMYPPTQMRPVQSGHFCAHFPGQPSYVPPFTPRVGSAGLERPTPPDTPLSPSVFLGGFSPSLPQQLHGLNFSPFAGNARPFSAFEPNQIFDIFNTRSSDLFRGQANRNNYQQNYIQSSAPSCFQGHPPGLVDIQQTFDSEGQNTALTHGQDNQAVPGDFFGDDIGQEIIMSPRPASRSITDGTAISGVGSPGAFHGQAPQATSSPVRGEGFSPQTTRRGRRSSGNTLPQGYQFCFSPPRISDAFSSPANAQNRDQQGSPTALLAAIDTSNTRGAQGPLSPQRMRNLPRQ